MFSLLRTCSRYTHNIPRAHFSELGNPFLALKMRGLPFKAEDRDVLQFFKGHNPDPDSVKLQKIAETGQSTGRAAVRFASEAKAKEAMNQRQGEKMGTRWIELFQISE